MKDLVFSVEELFKVDTRNRSLLSSHNKKGYNIPEYQRGYKWTSNEVEILLDDIYSFEGKDSEFYCLQGITLVENANDFFNVVDGQQRLTTLFILLAYLDELELIKDRLTYPENSIRSKTYEFLNDYILKKEEASLSVFELDWDTFNNATDGEYNYQDIYHIASTARTIHQWIRSKEETVKAFTKERFSKKILDNVKFIINNLKDTEEEKLFANVNSKRIPLDGADLVRAIIITKVAREEFGDFSTDPTLISKVNERRIRIGWELDQINHWWNQEEIKEYFAPFGSISSTGDIKFNTEYYPVNYLYHLYAEKEEQKILHLSLFEKKEAIALYKEIKELQTILQEWYNDPELYHLLGYLFHHRSREKDEGSYFKELVDFWLEENTTRQLFRKRLIADIRKSLFVKETDEETEIQDQINDLMPQSLPKEDDSEEIILDNKDWYFDKPSQKELIKVLLLQDIIYAEKQKSVSMRLSPQAFKRGEEDIEHIFPKVPAEKKRDELERYVEYLNEYVLPDNESKIRSAKILKMLDLKGYEEVKKELDKYIPYFNVNSIGNLVLLDASINRSIQNKPYAKKRVELIRKVNEGVFIHPHTLNVFTRNFGDNSSLESFDLEYWSKDDIENNFKSIKENLITFFQEEE